MLAPRAKRGRLSNTSHRCDPGTLACPAPEASSRMLKTSASGVLVSIRGSPYRSVRLASSLTAALLDGLFEHPETILPSTPFGRFQRHFVHKSSFPQTARHRGSINLDLVDSHRAGCGPLAPNIRALIFPDQVRNTIGNWRSSMFASPRLRTGPSAGSSDDRHK